MKKVFYIYIMTIAFLLLISSPVLARCYEGEIMNVDGSKQTLTLITVTGEQMTFKLASNANLFYNNSEATLKMYTPVTSDDYVSGYLETNAQGLIESAHFYYLVREGTIEEMTDTMLVLKQTESGIYDSYIVKDDAAMYLNNYPAEHATLAKGMKALLVLDHRFRVKKVAAFHYEYSGFIETLDLNTQTVVVNVGTRLHPEHKEFHIGGIIQGLCTNWENLAIQMKTSPLILVKFMIDQGCNTISFADIRSL